MVCTFYTAMGGLKAVVWTDVFQMIVVYAGLILIVVRGAQLFGGVEEIWTTALQGARINLNQARRRDFVFYFFYFLRVSNLVTMWQMPHPKFGLYI